MANIIANVTSIKGIFKAIDENGQERSLALGDSIFEGEKIVGSGNTDDAISVTLKDDAREIIVAGNEPLLFDASLYEEGFEDEEIAFNDDNYFEDLVDGIDSLNEMETVAGEEESSSEELSLEFAARTAGEADINSGLAKAKFKAPIIEEDKELVKSQLLNDLAKNYTSTIDRGGVVEVNEVEEFTTPNPTPNPTPEVVPPTIIPSVPPAVLNITVKLFAIDKDGQRAPANEVNEGNPASYIAVAFDDSGREVDINETVEVTFGADEDTATDKGIDYVSTTQTVTLGKIFTTDTVDDYHEDNSEVYSIQITDLSMTNPDDYTSVSIDTTPVTTTILDDTGTPNTPNDGPEDDKEIAQVVLVAVNEGETVADIPTDANGVLIIDATNTTPEGGKLYYIAVAVDEDGKALSIQDGTVDVTYNDNTATHGAGTQDDDYTSGILNTNIGEIFSVDAGDDYHSDNNENFTVVITNPVGTSYENIEVDTDNDTVTSTITDDTNDTSGNPDNPNKPPVDKDTPPSDENPEENHEIVILKIVAADENGNPLDTNGNIINSQSSDSVEYAVVNGVPEGDSANYIVYAFLPETTTFTKGALLENQLGSVDVSFTNETALGADSIDPSGDGSEDYVNETQKVTLGESFSVDTLDDYVSDNGETYKVKITENTYAPTDKDGITTGSYENVEVNEIPVTTTIVDDTDEVEEADAENVIIKLVAVNSDGDAIDVDGNVLTNNTQAYVFVNEVAEDDAAYYKALAFDADNTTLLFTSELSAQFGSVTVSSTDNDTQISGTDATGTNLTDTTQTQENGTQDYTNLLVTKVNLNEAFSIDTLDDYVADNGETFSVSITEDSYDNTLVNGTITPTYENVTESGTVVTTITDNTNTTPPTSPNPEAPENDREDVIVKLIALDESGDAIIVNGNYTFVNDVYEEGIPQYKALAFDSLNTTFANGSELANQLGSVTVSSSDNNTQISGTDATAGSDYTALSTMTIALDEAFAMTTLDDNIADNGETYTVSIGSYVEPTSGDKYENLTASGTVTTTINDNTNTPPPTPQSPETPEATREDVIVKLIAVNADGDAIDVNGSVITDANESYVFVNTAPEGDEAWYMAIAFNDGENNFTANTQLDNQIGGVEVKTADLTNPPEALGHTGTQTAIDGTQDYTTSTQTVELGVKFSVDALEDYLSDSGERFEVSITDDSYDSFNASETYENVRESGTVTTTITDNTTSEAVDTVYVKLTHDDSVFEGSDLTHRLELVDKNGNAITVAAGETITVTLAYSPTTIAGAEVEDYIADLSVDIVGGTSFTNFTNLAVVDFFNENDEHYDVIITAVTQANATYEHILPSTIANGAISDDISAVGTIKNVVLDVTPDDAYVDESDFSALNTNPLVGDRHDDDNGTPLNDLDDTIVNATTKLLNTTTTLPNSAYEFVFEESLVLNSDVDSDVSVATTGNTALTSNGVNILYSVSGSTLTAYTNANDISGTKVFDIVLSTNTNDDGSDDAYVYTQYNEIDHPTTVTSEDEMDDTLTMTFGFTINATNTTNGDDISNIQNFTVTVDDSIPSSDVGNQATNEDTDLVIVISDESFVNGEIYINNNVDGEQLIASANSINIYDVEGNDIVGTLLNNGNGTLTFTPNVDYSGETLGFSYTSTDKDGDTSSGTVPLIVNPIADAPTVDVNDVNTTEDDNNTQEGLNSVALNLMQPTLSKDQTDKNDINATPDNNNDDHAERLGYIELKFTNGSGVNGAILELGVVEQAGLITEADIATISSNNQTIKIVIVDLSGNIDTDYHHSDIGLNESGVIYLTTAEYEGLKIIPSEDNDRDIDINVGITSYEVFDDGTIRGTTADLSENTNATMTVVVAPRTDDISLVWIDTARGPISTTTVADDTYTFTGFQEGSTDRVIDLTSLLTQTSGYENDTTPLGGDLDGSEVRSYTISGIPPGSVISLNGASVTVADGDDSATITLNNATLQDPSFTLTLPEQYGGSIDSGVITLSVYDEGFENNSDTTNYGNGFNGIKTAEVYFTVEVEQVADDVTLQVEQASGNEDAGRTDGNIQNVNAELIDAPENGIELSIKTTSADIDGSETFRVEISGIPDGGTLYYGDTVNGIVTIDENGVVTGTNANISVINTTGSTWEVIIENFDNDTPLTFIPPHNSDDDYVFNVQAWAIDGVSTSSVSQTLHIDTTVIGVADIPINDDLASVTVSDSNNNTNSFTITAVEDTNDIQLQTIFATPNDIAEYDADTSEVLTMKVTGIDEGFDLAGAGATLITGTGEGRIWFVDIAELKLGNVILTRPSDFAGEMDFTVQFITTENEGDSATHPIKDVSLMVTPQTDTSSMTAIETQNEDETKALTFDFASTDTDGASAGEETLQTLSIDVSGLQAAGITLTSNGVDLTTGKSGHQSVNVVNGVPDVTSTITEDSHLGGSYSFNISYTFKDIAIDTANNTYIDNSGSVTNQLYTVNVTAITDDIDLSMTTTAGTNNTDNNGHVTVTGNGTFTKTLNITGIDSDTRGSLDEDSSEQFTRVTVSGVPEGITVGGADGVYAGDTGGGNYSGFWYVDIANIALDGSASYDLVFNVDGSFDNNDLGDYSITVTAFNEDNSNGVEENDSETFDLSINQSFTGAPGTPAVILDFYQDIDQDTTRDHSNAAMTDSDAYEGSVLREDTQFKLSDVVHVEIEDTNGGANAFSITLKNVPANVTIEGMTYNAQDGGFYTLSGNGNPQAVVDALQAIFITPIENENTDAGNILASDLAFDIELTTYATGAPSNTALINFTGSVLPLTDEMTLTVVNDSTTTEDTNQTFTVKLDNVADGANTVIVDGKVYFELNETYADLLGGDDGTTGSIAVTGKTVSTQTIDIGNGSQDYFVVNAVYNETLEFIYTPASDRNGSVSVTVQTQNYEGETWNTHTTQTLLSTQTIDFDITPATDGYTLDSSANRQGDEDTLIALDIAVNNTDFSEDLVSISLDGVPDGFLIFYGEQANASDKTLAQNIGDNGTTDIEMTYGVVTTEVANLWNIPLNGVDIPSYVWIQAPQNWSGTIPTMNINIIDSDGNETTNNLNVLVNSVVDTISLNTTKTFGDAGDDIELKLNANVEDLDGSETVKLELTGLGANAGFKVNGIDMDNANISYSGDTYTLVNIAAADINDITFIQSVMNADVSVNAYMQEAGGDESSVVTGTAFNVNISATSGDDTVIFDVNNSVDALGGDDVLVFNQDVGLDFSSISDNHLKNFENIDLSQNGNHSLTNLSLSDVVGLTPSGNDLKIFGDSSDNVNVLNEGGNTWTKGSTVTENGHTFDTYTNSGDNSVSVKIETSINDQII